YYLERLTQDLADRAWEHLTEVEEAGGMAEAIDAGIPKLRIEEAAARTQARIDSGRQALIGVKKYPFQGHEQVDVLKVDNARVHQEQVDKLQQLRAERDEQTCTETLRKLTAVAEASVNDERPNDLDHNLLTLAVDAARAKATVGEISNAL